MKLLFDQNLAPRLVTALADVYPGSVHVRDVGLPSAVDADVWSRARDHGLAIVSEDEDFVVGHPRRSSESAWGTVRPARSRGCFAIGVTTCWRSEPAKTDRS